MRAAEQILDLYERYAAAQAPLGLSELARQLGMPASTCFNLVRTFESRGYIYTTGPRRAFYPTKRMLALAQEIARHDPVGTDVVRCLEALRDETGETVVLASRHRDRVTYLEVLESPHRIRYSAQVGETRPIHVNSMGKALISLLPPAERAALADALVFERVTERSLDTPAKYLEDIERSIPRGWFLNDGESVPDVVAVAVPVLVHGSAFAVTLAGPSYRMAGMVERHAERVRVACRIIADGDGGGAAAA